MASQRTRGSNSSTGKMPKSKKTTPVKYPVCKQDIVDATKTTEGQDSVFCEGNCKVWLHRHCAGLTKSAFNHIQQWQSSKPFICTHCRLEAQENKIENKIKELQNLLASFQSLVSDLKSSAKVLNPIPTPESTVLRSYSNVVQSKVSMIPAKKSLSESEHKFNIVIYGLNECAEGTRRHVRTIKDLETAKQVIQPLDPKISEQSIHDCTRLGKYDKTGIDHI